MIPKEIGNLGEKIAQNYLKNKGYKILDRNYKIPGFAGVEIDIVAKRKDTFSFIEVKTLTLGQKVRASSSPLSLPEEKVNFPKQRKLIKAAQSWLKEKKIPLNSKWQIDVISIKIDLTSKQAKLRHFKNVVFN